MIVYARPAAGNARSEWYRFRIAEALGVGEHEVHVRSLGRRSCWTSPGLTTTSRTARMAA